ncbi:MAG: HEAT repeat domain-containing protein [Cyanobacteria bacterium]|nr:HEAT repeat domain-containing protein [Cyanobacteriota bacterium]
MTPDAIRTALGSDDLGDRLRAVNEIRQLEPLEGLPLLAIAAADANPRVRYAAVSQFDHCGDSDREATVALLRDRLLNDSEPDVQAAAADVLGALKATEAFEELAQVYRTTGEWLLKFSIISTLGELGDARAVDLLTEALDSPTELERLGAIGALGELQDPRAIALLLPLVSNEDWQIRHRTARALGSFRSDGTVRAALETLAADAVEQVAIEAKEQLNAN